MGQDIAPRLPRKLLVLAPLLYELLLLRVRVAVRPVAFSGRRPFVGAEERFVSPFVGMRKTKHTKTSNMCPKGSLARLQRPGIRKQDTQPHRIRVLKGSLAPKKQRPATKIAVGRFSDPAPPAHGLSMIACPTSLAAQKALGNNILSCPKDLELKG